MIGKFRKRRLAGFRLTLDQLPYPSLPAFIELHNVFLKPQICLRGHQSITKPMVSPSSLRVARRGTLLKSFYDPT